MFHLLLLLTKGAIVENLIDIGFSNLSELHSTDYKRATITKEGMELRSSADGGSLLNLPQTNPHDEWALEFTIDNINISFPQTAGIYLWYTNKPIDDGIFNGSSGIFTGLMIGLEFLGRNISLVLSTNDGTHNYTELNEPDIMTYRDSINPARFRNVKELRVKVISTSRNFKVEIYDKENLVYDSFRHISSDPLADLSKGKYFSITTEYDRVSHDKHILLRSIHLYERIEGEGYDHLAIKAPEPDTTPRFFDHIEHSNKEVQHLISLIEHTMKFTKEHIGKPSGSPVFQSLNDARHEIELFSKNIEELVTGYHAKKEGPNETVDVVVEKFKTVEDKMKYLQQSLDQVKSFLLHYDDKQSNKSSWIMKLLIIGVVCIGCIGGIRMLINRKTY